MIHNNGGVPRAGCPSSRNTRRTADGKTLAILIRFPRIPDAFVFARAPAHKVLWNDGVRAKVPRPFQEE
jgi:hypothetical protein